MKALAALFRETWWAWLLFLAIVVGMVVYIHLFFLVLLPMLLVVFVYFALGRFDSDGKPRKN